ncbi:MAG: YidH family protein [Synechococcus sp.]
MSTPGSSSDIQTSSLNPGTELAKERNRAAEERTLMAWIRTCLSLISFGFGIERIIAVLYNQVGDIVDPLRLSRVLGFSFVALGTVAMLLAALDYRNQLHRIQRNDLIYASRQSPTIFVAYLLALLGCFALVGIILSPFLD